VASLLRKIEGRGCALAADPVICEDVFEGAPLVGGYDAGRRVVVMNPAVPEGVLTQPEWTRTITHELVHAFDHCRAAVDNANCRHLACTEIRAANLSGDCDFGVELGRGGLRDFTVRGHQQKCVRRRAELSVSAHAHCVASPRGVRATVDDVWDACYGDVAPFATN
jgi:mitochondrial inner membrane protease ATP23